MKCGFTDTAKRNISLIIVLVLAVVYCGSIDLSCCSFNSGGSINGSKTIDISRSLLASVPAAVREDNGRSSGHDQNIEKVNIASDIFARIARKLAKANGCSSFSESVNYLRYYISSLCICNYAYLFLLTNIRFIHLKDGSK